MTKPWEGNIRELKNEAERFLLGINLGDTATPNGSSKSQDTTSPEKLKLTEQVGSFEKTTIEQELIRQKGDIKNTYTSLGIPRQTLYDKMNKYGLKRSNYV